MKNKFVKIGAVALSTLAVGSAVSLSFATHSAGSDPLVTLSYLTEIIMPQMKQDILAELMKNPQDANTSDNTATVPEENTVHDEAAFDGNSVGAYTLLELSEGECLYTSSALEFIVRPGSSVTAISPFEYQGIADITNAVEYLDGDTISVNSYCIIPRADDGRGIRIENEKSYVLVRGEYYIG